MICVLTVMFFSYRLRFIDPDLGSLGSWIWEFKDFRSSGEILAIVSLYAVAPQVFWRGPPGLAADAGMAVRGGASGCL